MSFKKQKYNSILLSLKLCVSCISKLFFYYAKIAFYEKATNQLPEKEQNYSSMKKIWTLVTFLSFVALCLPQTTYANHLIGGELTYECLGGNDFEITLTIYRDCNCVDCAFFDDPANITVFDEDGDVVNTFGMFDPIIADLEPNTEGLCLETIPDVCVQKGVYTRIVELFPFSGGVKVVHQRCCRNNTIQNLVDPSDQGSTYVAEIPEFTFNNCENSSPTFNNFPPIIICSNSPLLFDHAATDLDGDSLVYSLCEPVIGATQFDPAPEIASDPPYPVVTYTTGFSYTNPFGSTLPLEINAQTGLLTGFPEIVGQYVVGVCVSEYRNGQLLSTNRRDFQFNVADCEVILAIAGIRGPNYICEGEGTTLDGQVFGEDEWFWTPTEGLANPNSLDPNVNITETTTFVLTAQNTSGTCFDTDSITIYVNEPVAADAGPDVNICGDPVQLTGSGGVFYLWDPSDGLSNPDICCPIANPIVTTTYTLFVADESGACIASDEITVTVADSPPIIVQTNAILEGAYNTSTGMMNTTLKSEGLLPLNQPYNRPPWNYNGGESVANQADIPTNTVDWVLVEIRSAADAEVILSNRAAFLLDDGNIVDIDGVTNGTNICGLESGTEYYIVVRHRNHLAVMSADPITLPNVTTYDFSIALTQAAGTNQMKVMDDSLYALYAGDFNSDGVITVGDFNLFASEAGSINQYLDGDGNLDRAVSIADLNFYQPNISIIGITEIRY